jgi:hypothetical protein
MQGKRWEVLPEIDWHVEEVVFRLHPARRDLLVLDKAVLIDDGHQPLLPARKGLK